MKTYYSKQGLERIITKLYHLQSKGLIKRLNGSLMDEFSKLISDTPSYWPKHLPAALLMTRVHTNRGTSYSPFNSVQGTKHQITHNKTGALNLVEPTLIPAETPKLQDLCDKAKIADSAHMERKFLPLINGYKVGDEVWLLNPNQTRIQSEKKLFML